MAERGPHIRISRSDDGTIVWLWINGSTHTFMVDDWRSFLHLTGDFERLAWAGALSSKSVQNFTDLPTRTPLHANKPLQPTADDLA